MVERRPYKAMVYGSSPYGPIYVKISIVLQCFSYRETNTSVKPEVKLNQPLGRLVLALLTNDN